MQSNGNNWPMPKILLVSAAAGLIVLLLLLLWMTFSLWSSIFWGVVIGAVVFFILMLNYGDSADSGEEDTGGGGYGAGASGAGAGAAATAGAAADTVSVTPADSGAADVGAGDANDLLVAVTEKRTKKELEAFASELREAVQ